LDATARTTIMPVIRRGLIGALALSVAGTLALAAGGHAAEPARLRVTVDHIRRTNDPIPQRYAFCVPAAQGHSKMGADVNPAIRWSKGPAATKSYAVIVHDTDVPSTFDDADKEGRTIPKDLKRVDFTHMVLVDIPATMTELPEGADSDRLTPKGKPTGPTSHGVRGANSYGQFMSGAMAGTSGGYDGPCPPWNDTIPHHYHFTVYALDVPSLGLTGAFTADDARKAMKGHVLGAGTFTATYTQNPALMKAAKKK
jgi:Raf kinase inhibitor-like YbhB/YbcL family protein